MPGSLDSCINNVYEPGNIPASSGTPPVRVLLKDALEAAISEAAAAVDVVDVQTAIDAVMVEAATAADAPDSTLVSALPPWALVNSWTWSGNVAQVDFTGLAAYSELRIVIDGITSSVSGSRQVLVSTNNGSTFLTTSGDYVTVDSNGVESNATGITFAGSTAAAVSAEILINGFKLTALKVAQRQTPIDIRTVIIPTSSALNAVRINNSAGGNLTAGAIYLYAR